MSVKWDRLAQRRRRRTRNKLQQAGKQRPRLSVFRSGRHIYAQVIDDGAGRTVAQASSKEQGFSGGKGSNVSGAAVVGKLVAERALAAGIKDVVFDRGSYIYHGRVKALAEAAREGGLQF